MHVFQCLSHCEHSVCYSSLAQLGQVSHRFASLSWHRFVRYATISLIDGRAWGLWSHPASIRWRTRCGTLPGISGRNGCLLRPASTSAAAEMIALSLTPTPYSPCRPVLGFANVGWRWQSCHSQTKFPSGSHGCLCMQRHVGAAHHPRAPDQLQPPVARCQSHRQVQLTLPLP